MIVEFWLEMGFMRYPLGFSTMVVLGLTAFSAYRLFRTGASADLRTKAWVDAILFWGGFAVVFGVLGTLIGINIAARSIEAATAVQPRLVWGGMRVAFSTSLFGMLVMAVASLAWFGLQLKWRFLEADEDGRPA